MVLEKLCYKLYRYYGKTAKASLMRWIVKAMPESDDGLSFATKAIDFVQRVFSAKGGEEKGGEEK